MTPLPRYHQVLLGPTVPSKEETFFQQTVLLAAIVGGPVFTTTITPMTMGTPHSKKYYFHQHSM